ncbi:Peptidase C15 pyroglutamyl peptidase I [Hyella patelloides LEGE 07179]|uniref:Peptidase C15 pyroglutamyl peptidase I n=1 Tax=Hyella patelloides LEGE 07179 TaxID=945734 RepID=A0A563W1W9_9CYAN|nr:peptidase C15 [Hyella patelloides]VEP17692.1 Peptidase C15 pyroglutamyl peptidase I [Hyella patelloides LEGE 07179]VEP17711.1 Peptidase C15 pyroglutamyl peptidase I [Hyella patelloides LEGE 07179]
MTILLTSFTTWLPHQKSNSSDDLLNIVEKQNKYNCYYLRQLPVEIETASKQAIAIIKKIQPSAIICCGMAESRFQLTIESHARCQESYLQTTVNLTQLVSQLSHTSISNDAGQFVCEELYYQVLNYLQLNNLALPCIFVHVPVLTTHNQEIILPDFASILEFLAENSGV